MALSRLFPPGYVFSTVNGQEPAASGQVFFYDNGTTDLATVYTDEGGLTPSSNPLTLGSDGRLPNDVFTSETLRVKQTDSLGATVFQKDDVVAAAGVGVLSASSGASLVGFINSGAGATARTVQERLRDTINAKDYGATGDGSTTDTTALQTAITAAAGKTLIIPAGTYLTGALTVSSGTRIISDGRGKTVLKAASASGSLDLLTISSSSVEVSDLTIDLNNTANTIAAGFVANRNGIYCVGSVGTYIDNICLNVQV